MLWVRCVQRRVTNSTFAKAFHMYKYFPNSFVPTLFLSSWCPLQSYTVECWSILSTKLVQRRFVFISNLKWDKQKSLCSLKSLNNSGGLQSNNPSIRILYHSLNFFFLKTCSIKCLIIKFKLVHCYKLYKFRIARLQGIFNNALCLWVKCIIVFCNGHHGFPFKITVNVDN